MSASATSLGTLVIELTGESMRYRAMWKDAESLTETSCANLTKMVTGMSIAAVAALVAIGTVAVAEFAKFDEAMTESLAIMENVSDVTRRTMEETAREVARNTKTSAVQAAQGFQFLASAGWDAQQSMKALPQVAKFASAANVEMAKATDLLTSSQAGLGLVSKDAAQNLANLTRITDVLTQAANISNASAEDLAISLRTKVAAAARLLGKDVEEVVAVLGAYADQGIKAENAGEMLSQAMRDMQKVAIDQKDVWTDYGLAVFDSVGKVRPLVDIIKDLETATVSLTDRQKTLLFQQLGFQDRTVASVKALLGTSDKIREYEKSLRSAGGATDEVSKKQLSSFNAQLTITKNRVNDLFIKIGQDLAPMVLKLNTIIGDSTEAQGGFAEKAQLISDVIQTTLVVTMGIVSNVMYGWNMIVKVGSSLMITMAGAFTYASKAIQVGILAAGAVIEAVMRGWQRLFYSTIYVIQAGFSKFAIWSKEMAISVAESLNKILPKANQYSSAWFDAARKDVDQWKKTLDDARRSFDDNMAGTANVNAAAFTAALDDFKNFHKDMAAENDEFSTANKATWAEIWKMIEQGAPYDVVTGKMREVAAAAKGTADAHTTAAAAAQTHAVAVGAVTAAYARLSPEVQEALNSIKYEWEVNKSKLQDYDKMLKDNAITTEEWQRLRHGLNLKGSAEDPMETAIFEIMRLDAAMKAGIINAQEYDQAVRKSLEQGSSLFGNQGSSEEVYKQQLDQLKKQYELQRKIAVDSKKITNEQLLAMDKNYVNQTLQLTSSLKEAQLNMASTVVGMAATVSGQLEGLAQAGTGAAKAFFVMSKAIAIGQAIINTELAATRAMAEGGMFMGIPMATAIRAMGYASVALIAAQTIASFEGGGSVPSGPRSGGMDGRGGRLAVLHPDEKILDPHSGGGMGGDLTINVHNYTDSDVQVKPGTDGRTIDMIVKRTKSELASDIRNGGTPVTQALEQTYRLPRNKV